MNHGSDIELRSEEFQEVLGSVPHWILRWGITVLAAVVVILLTGSAVFKYPDVLSSQVLLTGSTPPAVVVSHASGKLKELFVADNQGVKTGDYLAVIDNPAKTEDVVALKNCLDSLSLNSIEGTFLHDNIQNYFSGSLFRGQGGEFGSLQSLYSSFSATLFEYSEYRRLLYYPQKLEITKERIVQYEKQYQNLQSQQKIIVEQSEIAEKQYQRDSVLFASGSISKEEIEQSRSRYLQSRLADENMLSSLRNMQIQIAQLKESLLDISHQDEERLNSLQSQLRSQLSQLKTEIQTWELNYTLIAPIDGTVTFTNYWVENQNVTAGSAVFTVVPNGTLPIIGKAMLPVARSGKVKQGQKVNIRLHNFPENEYGILRGTVQNISLTPVQTGGEAAYYSVEIALTNGLVTTYKKELPYLSDMQGQADIITQDLSLLERLVLPVKKILRNQ